MHDNQYAKRIARLYRDLGQTDKAIEYGLQSVYVDPYDSTAHELLAELCRLTRGPVLAPHALAACGPVVPPFAPWSCRTLTPA